MKKKVRYAITIHVIVFVIVAILDIVCNFSIYHHSKYFLDIKSFYLLSVIVSLIILWKIAKSEKTEHKILYIAKNILVILMLAGSVFYFITISFFTDNSFSNYLILENKNINKTIVIHQYSVARTGFISVYEQYLNFFLIEKEKIELGNETSAEISDASLNDKGNLTLECILHTKYNGNITNIDYDVNISK